MEADRWGAKMWTISHKPVAVAAGLGHMGIHRNLIHPKFGNFVLLGTLLMDGNISSAIVTVGSADYHRQVTAALGTPTLAPTPRCRPKDFVSTKR